MPAKEIKQNKEAAGAIDTGTDLKVPPTGMPVEAVIVEEIVAIPEASGSVAVAPTVAVAPIGKITPGKRMRDSARLGGRGAGHAGGVGAGGGQRGAGQRGGGSRGSGGRGGGRGGDSRERVKPEFDSKIIDIRRVTRVTAGGRRMNFSVAVVAGDRKGRVGVGLGKGGDTAGAVEKATREAKKHLIRVPLSANMTIPHAVEAKLGSAMIKIFPARGSGIVAGSSARAVIELAGIRDVCAKILSGSKNRLNNARVAIKALDSLVKSPRADRAARTVEKAAEPKK